MITLALVTLFLGTFSGLLNIAPAATLDVSGLVANVGMIAGLGGTLNGYFPLITLGVCLGIVMGLKVFMVSWRLVLFVYHQFWGSS